MNEKKEVLKKISTPITYYGGKQKLAKEIIRLIPPHNLYAEPFVGGAAVFFAKQPSNVEVINDTNSELVNFYKVLQNNFVELEKLVSVTLHSRRLHSDAKVVYDNPHLFSEVKRAWAVWGMSTQGFAGQLDGSWGYDKQKHTTSLKISNKRNAFTFELSIRLQNVQVECADALYIIQSRDTASSFFYCDPPYYNSNCGHYDGYTIDDFERLLQFLSKINGKFMLSSYPSDTLKKYTKEFGWHNKCYEQGVSVNNRSGYTKKKWEMITCNYAID
jgi:DNA adenine methylase